MNKVNKQKNLVRKSIIRKEIRSANCLFAIRTIDLKAQKLSRDYKTYINKQNWYNYDS